MSIRITLAQSFFTIYDDYCSNLKEYHFDISYFLLRKTFQYNFFITRVRNFKLGVYQHTRILQQDMQADS